MSGTVGGRPSDASFGFHLRKAFQSQTKVEKIVYNEIRKAVICYRNL